MKDIKIVSGSPLDPRPLSDIVSQKGLKTLTQLLSHVEALPYGRNEKRGDFSLVIKEGKGTCSSKHALIAAVAKEQKWTNVDLILCIYKMDGHNTPGIGNLLNQADLAYIPEAHCYLIIDGQRVDITNIQSEFKRIEEAVLEEKIIDSNQVISWKVEYHQQFLRDWNDCKQNGAVFDKIWSVRESCIHQLEMMCTFT